MAKYDIESFIDDLQTYLKANLNTKITAINTEKGDSVLSAIDDSAYAMLTIEDEHLNYDPFISILIDNIDVKTSLRAITPKKYEISIVICFEGANDGNDKKKMLRYLRALEDLMTDGYNSVAKHVNYNVESLVPVSIQFMNKPAFHRAVGISLNLTILN